MSKSNRFYVKHLDADVDLVGVLITCPECGSLDEVDYSPSLDRYRCAFDGASFDARGNAVDYADADDFTMNVVKIYFR